MIGKSIIRLIRMNETFSDLSLLFINYFMILDLQMKPFRLLTMSVKKVSTVSNSKEVDDHQSHSDSDSQFKEKNKVTFLKLEKKKQISSNFGRPRKHPYKPGKYKCNFCDTLCSKPSVLTKHLRAHTNERPFPCGLCKRNFKTKSNLSKHEKSKSHSLKLGENNNLRSTKMQSISVTECSTVANTSSDAPNSLANMEFDGIPSSRSAVQSSGSSPTASDDKSSGSDENGYSEMIKKEKAIDLVQDHSGDLSEMIESSNSCSGVLTINSQGGPITVEVQINLETMRHLQHGFSNLNHKKNGPLSPAQSINSRNDAEMQAAAESILHMANMRPVHSEALITKDDISKNGHFPRRFPGDLSPVSRKSPEILNPFKIGTLLNNIVRNSPTKDSNSNKSTPIEDPDPSTFKIQTKSLVKENLLKKMKKKLVLETITLPTPEPVTITTSFSSISNKTSELNLPVSGVLPNNLFFNKLHPSFQKAEKVPQNLISDSTSPVFLPKPNKAKPRFLFQKAQLMNSNSNLINRVSITSASHTIVLFTPANQSPKTIISDSKTLSSIGIGSVPDPKFDLSMNSANLDIDAAVLSQVITNTQNLHKHQGNNISNADNLSITNSITSSRVAISSASIDSKNNLSSDCYINYSPDPVQRLVKNELIINTEKEDLATLPYQKQVSNPAAQESETDSSPRLCIVEEFPNQGSFNFTKKSSESDEEIDVVNTDSDEDRNPLQRKSDVLISESSSKRRKSACDNDIDSVHKEIKRIKEMDKCIPLHAPNINAKDLMQDCPLNLSANRQPTIPLVPQIPVSVLQNLYQTISSPSVSIPSSNSPSNTSKPHVHISSLTNHNPAHPQSFQTFPTTASFSTNGHHHDYPIFEDKMMCDVCSQMIEPSMLSLHKNMHIYTNSKDPHSHGSNNIKSGSSISSLSSTCSSNNSQIPFNKPRNHKCVVCSIAFRVIGHLRKHHKSKSHLQGLVNSGFLSKELFSKIEQSKVPIQEVIDQKTGNIIPDMLSRYISNLSSKSASEPGSPHS